MVAYSYKKRFIVPIKIGLGLPILPEDRDDDAATMLLPKRQTIRALGKRRHARAGETLQLYYAQRTKQCRKISDARCVSVQEIRIQVHVGCIIVGGTAIFESPSRLDAFARTDGFANWQDMQAFWKQEHGDLVRLGPFIGVLIKWEPLKGATNA